MGSEMPERVWLVDQSALRVEAEWLPAYFDKAQGPDLPMSEYILASKHAEIVAALNEAHALKEYAHQRYCAETEGVISALTRERDAALAGTVARDATVEACEQKAREAEAQEKERTVYGVTRGQIKDAMENGIFPSSVREALCLDFIHRHFGGDS